MQTMIIQVPTGMTRDQVFQILHGRLSDLIGEYESSAHPMHEEKRVLEALAASDPEYRAEYQRQMDQYLEHLGNRSHNSWQEGWRANEKVRKNLEALGYVKIAYVGGDYDVTTCEITPLGRQALAARS